MFKLSVCAETTFLSLPFELRLKKIAEAGFAAEFWRWDQHDVDAIAKLQGIEIRTFSGCLRGSMMHPDGVDIFIEGLKKTLDVAKRLGCQNLILLSGEMGPKGEVAHQVAEHPATCWVSAYKTICRVAELAEKNGVNYNLEHLNTKLDHPHYPFSRVEDVTRLVKEVGSPRIKILLDIYHAQTQEGNLLQLIRENKDHIGHVHVADVPGRHEPGTGEIDYARVAQCLREVGYNGSIGLEAFPEKSDDAALAKFRKVFS
jgi:hydroxypyruvate isomerase